MIPALIFWLIKKYIQPHWKKETILSAFKKMAQARPGKAFIILLLILPTLELSAQEQTRDYIVSYKGDNVGKMKLYQNKAGNSTYIKIVSAVEMRFIFMVKVLTEEESVFKNGHLVYSKLSRNVNGKENTSKQTKACGDIYQISSGGINGATKNMTIDYNLHLLYSYEPENINKVYSDNFQQFLPIQKVADHKYKIVLPDGSYNFYCFGKGICNKVEVHHSLYSIQITLKE